MPLDTTPPDLGATLRKRCLTSVEALRAVLSDETKAEKNWCMFALFADPLEGDGQKIGKVPWRLWPSTSGKPRASIRYAKDTFEAVANSVRWHNSIVTDQNHMPSVARPTKDRPKRLVRLPPQKPGDVPKWITETEAQREKCKVPAPKDGQVNRCAAKAAVRGLRWLGTWYALHSVVGFRAEDCKKCRPVLGSLI